MVLKCKFVLIIMLFKDNFVLDSQLSEPTYILVRCLTLLKQNKQKKFYLCFPMLYVLLNIWLFSDV